MPHTKTHSETKFPKHVAIIMDGNGRWAKERGLKRIDGHRKGAERIEDVLEGATECGVKFITLYAFSSENWNRPKDEVDALMKLLASAVKKYGKNLVKNKIRFITIGDLSALPPQTRKAIDGLVEDTKNFDALTLVMALNYGSRDELVRTVSNIAAEAADGKVSPEKISWDYISGKLDTANIPDPDFLIRTSGEMRLSNYLMLQAAYAELYFTKTYWPDFTKEKFVEAVEEYKRRERRYGLTADQLNNK